MDQIKRLFRLLYKALPLKRGFFTLLRRIYVPPRVISQHLYFQGHFQTIDDHCSFLMVNYNSALETSVFWDGIGGWERASEKLWLELCRNAQIILDIGANTGLYCLIAKNTNPNADVYGFEPIPRFYEKLSKNCQINNFQLDLLPYAVSNQDGEATIYDLPLEHHRHASFDSAQLSLPDSKLIELTVPTKRLETFVQEKHINKIDLMKIDVEGHEVQVLEGMGEALHLMKPDILIEIKHENLAREIESVLDGIDYLFFDIDEQSGPERVRHLRKSSSRNYLLCRANTAVDLDLL